MGSPRPMDRRSEGVKATHPARSPVSDVLVIGPGALGAWTAARLAHEGHQVTVGCRSRESARHIQEHGVVAIDHDGTRIQAPATATHRPRDLTSDVDLVVLATKCAAAATAWKAWRGPVPDPTPVVALQNGLMGDLLAPVVGGRLVLCTVSFPATRTAVGESERTGPGGYLLGAWPPRKRPEPLEEQARAILGDAAPADVVEDIEGVQWTKLLLNSCITTLGALTGERLSGLLQEPKARDVFIDIFTEGRQVGEAVGVRFRSIHGLHPRRIADRRPGQGRRIRHLLLRVAAARFGRHLSSSLQSLERGEKTEVDYLNGAIVDVGRRHNISTPVNAGIVERIHALENSESSPAMAHLHALPSGRP